jgi:heme exporter protein A
VQILAPTPGARPTSCARQVGLLSHAHFVYEDLSGLENMTFAARLLGEPRPPRPEHWSGSGSSPADDRPVRAYSAGMRRRLALARLFPQAAAVALLDEPFVELDPDGGRGARGPFRELRAAGTTLVLATHHIEQGLQLCTDRLHLEQGRSIAA